MKTVETKHFENKAATKLKWLQLTREYCDLPGEATPLHYFIFHTLLEWSDNPDGPTKCWLSQKHIGHLCSRKSRETANAYIADLERWKVISVRTRYNDSNVMVIHWQNLPGGDTVIEEMKRYRNAASENTDFTLQPEVLPVVRTQTSHYEAAASTKAPVVWNIGFAGSVESNNPGSVKTAATGSVKTVPTLKVLKENPESIFNDAADENDVLLIWNSWNSEIQKIDVGRVVPIPSQKLSTNPAFKKIAAWIESAGSDWLSRWQRVQTEINGNNLFSGGIQNWRPTLIWLFSVSKNVVDDGQLNIDTIVAGKYNHAKKQITWGLDDDGRPTEKRLEAMRQGMKGMKMLD